MSFFGNGMERRVSAVNICPLNFKISRHFLATWFVKKYTNQKSTAELIIKFRNFKVEMKNNFQIVNNWKNANALQFLRQKFFSRQNIFPRQKFFSIFQYFRIFPKQFSKANFFFKMEQFFTPRSSDVPKNIF